MNKEHNTAHSAMYELKEKTNGARQIQVKGRLDSETSPSFLKDIGKLIKKNSPISIIVDLSEITYLDDFGAFALLELRQEAVSKGGSLVLSNRNDKIENILSMVHFDSGEICRPLVKPKTKPGFFVRIGEESINNTLNIRFMTSFIGSVMLSFFRVCASPGKLRREDLINHMKDTGVDALPVVGLISFLLGLIMAFMSSLQLNQFGANIYVASLVALAMVSELGPIMTAIVVAGRSGSAFAAEIGTMQISEEIDALFAMGFDPTLFLALPRVLASLIVIPILTVFADIFAIAGGMVIAVFMLKLTPASYVDQTIKVLTLSDIIWSLFKSGVFAIIISMVGCLRGFNAKGGASSVGNAATSAVVTSIFMIILFDSIFAIIRSYW